MKLWSLLRGDIRFQYKYGFYFLYIFFTVIYISLLSVIPEGWREKSAILMIFSDPSAMGLYFMGAIILFEKSERVLDSISISPVKVYEYTFSKHRADSANNLYSGCCLAVWVETVLVIYPSRSKHDGNF